MATKISDIDVAAGTGAWSLLNRTMTAGAKTVTLRRKSDGAVLATRSFTVAAAANHLIPPNPQFDIAFSGGTPSTTEWAGGGNFGRNTGSKISGANSAYASAYSTDDGEGNPLPDMDGVLLIEFTKAAVDASDGIIQFERILEGGDGTVSFWVHALGLTGLIGVYIMETESPPQSRATKSFNLKSLISAHIDSGKTWADVTSISFGATVHSNGTSIGDGVTVFIDNFT
jgi:hypothetical protein